MVRNLRIPYSRYFLTTMRNLPQPLRLPTWHSILKRFHPQGCILAGDAITEEDKKMIQQYDQMVDRLFTTLEPDILTEPPASRSVFKKAAISMFEDILQANSVTIPTRQIRLINQFHNCTLHTFLETMSTRYPFCYHHSVFSKSGELLLQRCSIMQALGISSQTLWYDITDKELAGVLETLSRVVKDFVAFCESVRPE